MAVLATFIANKMIKDYTLALQAQYEQGAGYVASSIESMLDSYNTVSKMPYFYNFNNGAGSSYLSFDHFRQILYGEGYEPAVMEEERKRDMGNFLQYIQSVDSYITGVHGSSRRTARDRSSPSTTVSITLSFSIRSCLKRLWCTANWTRPAGI